MFLFAVSSHQYVEKCGDAEGWDIYSLLPGQSLKPNQYQNGYFVAKYDQDKVTFTLRSRPAGVRPANTTGWSPDETV